MYDECGNKCFILEDLFVKRYVLFIEMNEVFFCDVVKEMIGDDIGSFMSNLISLVFGYVY